MKKFEQQNNQETVYNFEDLRGLDLSQKDLKFIPVEVLVSTDFDTQTKWPKSEKLPSGFHPEKLLEESKNPGLEIKELHREGIDGRGVKVAIIDQTLSFEHGKILPHVEYVSNIIDYKEYGDAEKEEISMHGPAVASLLVGKTCGVAPGVELVYKATPSGRDFNHKADALLDIIESNKKLSPKDRVRVVSCSIGYMEKNPEPDLERWIGSIKKAEEEGIIFVDVGDRNGIDFVGGGSFADKDDIEKYDPALFFKEKEKAGDFNSEIFMIIPSDYRSMSSNTGPEEYMYNGKGGMSWSVPYLAGLFALALQINPGLTQKELSDLVNKTASVNKKGLKVVNPRGFIKAIQK